MGAGPKADPHNCLKLCAQSTQVQSDDLGVVQKVTAGAGVAIGPVLLGCARAVHILTPSATVRRIVNMTALTVADANASR